MATEKTASFTIPIRTESDARQTATDLESLRDRIVASQAAVKDYAASLRTLRGASDEVKAAREDLKAKIDAERDAISRSSVEILKQGSSLERLTAQQRAAAQAAEQLKAQQKEATRAADELKKHLDAAKEKAAADAAKKLAESLALQKKRTDETDKAVRKIGGPVAELREKMGGLKEIMGGANSASGALTVGLSATAAVAAVVVAAVAAVTVAVVAATVAFAKFALEGANWNRTANLMREAAGGSASNATALGHQIDALSRKVATSKQELNELGLSLTRSFLGSRVSGEGLVDTFNAVAQASAAMGNEAGSKIQGIIDRAKTFGRLSLGRFELQGTGIGFEDVAGKLAKQLKIGLDDARFQLLTGFVDVNAGAKAIRDAVEQRFAGINLRRMLDVDVIKAKLGEFLTALTSDINLEPLLAAFKDLASIFDTTTVTGAALKDLVTDLGNALGAKAADGVGLLKRGIQQLVIWALELEIAFLKNRKTLAEWGAKILENQTLVLTFKAIGAGIVAMVAVAGVALGALAAAVAGTIAFVGAPFLLLWKGFQFLKGIDWTGIGSAIVNGLIGGLTATAGKLYDLVVGIAGKVKDSFKRVLGINSPSTVFAGYGANVVAGFVEGVDRNAPAASAATAGMAPAAPAAPATGGAGGLRTLSVPVSINVAPGAQAEQTARSLSAPDFLAQLTKAVEEAIKGAGIPTMQPAGG